MHGRSFNIILLLSQIYIFLVLGIRIYLIVLY
jgi:hypothetical protein